MSQNSTPGRGGRSSAVPGKAPSAAANGVQDRIAQLAREAGFALGGMAAVPEPGATAEYPELGHVEEWVEQGRAGEMEYLKRRDDADRLLRSSLRIALPWARSVVVCAANYNAAAPSSIDLAPGGSGWIARYAWTGMVDDTTGQSKPTDYHTVLLVRLRRLEATLKEQFGPFESRSYVDTGPLVERVYARYAGIGWIGKNTCILNQELGSWLFLGVIVTSLELPDSGLPGFGLPGLTAADENAPPLRAAALLPPAPLLVEDRCGSCTRCIDACPTGALTEPYRMDARLCIAYLTIEKRGAIPEELRTGIGRQVFGCDICQDVCPWNRRTPVSSDAALATRPELVNPALEWLAGLDAAAFNRLFNGSPVKRTKRAGLLRNVAIAMGNSGDPAFLPRLEEWRAGDDPVLAEAAVWAITRITHHPGETGREETSLSVASPQMETAS